MTGTRERWGPFLAALGTCILFTSSGCFKGVGGTYLIVFEDVTYSTSCYNFGPTTYYDDEGMLIQVYEGPDDNIAIDIFDPMTGSLGESSFSVTWESSRQYSDGYYVENSRDTQTASGFFDGEYISGTLSRTEYFASYSVWDSESSECTTTYQFSGWRIDAEGDEYARQ